MSDGYTSFCCLPDPDNPCEYWDGHHGDIRHWFQHLRDVHGLNFYDEQVELLVYAPWGDEGRETMGYIQYDIFFMGTKKHFKPVSAPLSEEESVE